MANHFPSMAPLEHLDDKKNGFKPYRECLDAVFNDPTLRNIAIMGPRGSGKSSILHSYDNSRSNDKNEKKEFLYVSLIDFEGAQSAKKKEDRKKTAEGQEETGDKPKTDGDVSGKEEKEEKKADQDKIKARLEYNLLCQVLVRCGPKDLQGCSLKGVPEVRPDSKWPAVYLSAMAALIFVLCCEERIGAALRWLNWDVGLRVCVHAALYLVFGGLLCGGVFVLARKFLPMLRLQNLTVKHDKAELALAVEDGRLCLDQYKFELIAILDRIYDRIGGTVIFEDMERLDEPVCVEIMTKLRDLNGLINTYRRQHGRGTRPIRFLYVLSDDVFADEERSKFFDFIMPVTPVMNARNAEAQFILMMNPFGVGTKECQQLLDLFPPERKDMRTVRNIVGEYQLLLNICQENGYSNIEPDKLLALICCKVLYPVDRAGDLLRGLLSQDSAAEQQEKAIGEIEQDFGLDGVLDKLLHAPRQFRYQQLHILKEGTAEEKRNLLCDIRHRKNQLLFDMIWEEELMLRKEDPEVRRMMTAMLSQCDPPPVWLERKLSKLAASEAEEAKQILTDMISLLEPFDSAAIKKLCQNTPGDTLSAILQNMQALPQIDHSALGIPLAAQRQVMYSLLADLEQDAAEAIVAELFGLPAAEEQLQESTP